MLSHLRCAARVIRRLAENQRESPRPLLGVARVPVPTVSVAGLRAAAWPFTVAVAGLVYAFLQMPPAKSALVRASGPLAAVSLVPVVHSRSGTPHYRAAFEIQAYPQLFYTEAVLDDTAVQLKGELGAPVEVFYDPHPHGVDLMEALVDHRTKTYGLTVNGVTVQSVDTALQADWGWSIFVGGGLAAFGIGGGIWKYQLAALAKPS